MKKLLMPLIISTILNAQNMTSQKTVCMQQSEKTLTEQKKALIELAKQESLEELYGTLIVASTNIRDGKFISEDIKSRAVGAVRVKGNPKFSYLLNLQDACTRR